MIVNFWLDPICPWCWMTSRWIKEVAPHRDLDIQWRPISLLLKNDPPPDSPYYEVSLKGHRLLRVLQAAREAGGNAKIGDLYTEYGTRIHVGQDLDFDPAEVLAAVGLDPGLAKAADDKSWDAKIREEMDAGLVLTGDDVGTPLIGFDDTEGKEVAIFGPVISRFYETDEALRLWDGMYLMASTPGFWELKRTRHEDPAQSYVV